MTFNNEPKTHLCKQCNNQHGYYELCSGDTSPIFASKEMADAFLTDALRNDYGPMNEITLLRSQIHNLDIPDLNTDVDPDLLASIHLWNKERALYAQYSGINESNEKFHETIDATKRHIELVTKKTSSLLRRHRRLGKKKPTIIIDLRKEDEK